MGHLLISNDILFAVLTPIGASVWTLLANYLQSFCGKETNYVQFKYYGADGEYACVEIGRNKKGQFVILPHEYGKYSYKNGAYSEMGRPATDPKNFVIVDKNTIHGRWLTRNDVWKKANMPKKLVDYILNYCCPVKNCRQ